MRRGALFCTAMAFAVLLALTARAHARTPEQVIVVDVQRMSLTLYEDRQEIARYPVAAGTSETPSPLGVFHIVRRFRPESGGFGTCFLGLDVPWGEYGIHGTNRPASIGSLASHGCIRMYNRDAEALYARVRNGATVIIEGGPYGELGDGLRTLRPGDRCSHVRVVQRRLRALGWYAGEPDGIYGVATSEAVLRFREGAQLGREDVVDGPVYAALGLMLFE